MYPADSSPAAAQDSILIVDDEAPILEAFAAALSPHFDVSSATSAREADFLLRKKVFKVVISDHLMPGGNGMSFLVRAREEYPEMQRILVTGYMKPEMLIRSVNEAALFRYLLKPVALTELVKVVQDAVRHQAEDGTSRDRGLPDGALPCGREARQEERGRGASPRLEEPNEVALVHEFAALEGPPPGPISAT
jgi:DNA-binding NtrC family response regulator